MMKGVFQAIGIVGLAAAAATSTWLLRGAPKRMTVLCDPVKLPPGEICLETLLGDGQAKVLWVDARSRSEWRRDGLKDSILWNTDPKEDASQFEVDAQQRLFDTDASVAVVYCSSEACGTSKQVADMLRKLSGDQCKVFVLHGGASALADAGLLKVSNRNP